MEHKKIMASGILLLALVLGLAYATESSSTGVPAGCTPDQPLQTSFVNDSVPGKLIPACYITYGNETIYAQGTGIFEHGGVHYYLKPICFNGSYWCLGGREPYGICPACSSAPECVVEYTYHANSTVVGCSGIQPTCSNGFIALCTDYGMYGNNWGFSWMCVPEYVATGEVVPMCVLTPTTTTTSTTSTTTTSSTTTTTLPTPTPTVTPSPTVTPTPTCTSDSPTKATGLLSGCDIKYDDWTNSRFIGYNRTFGHGSTVLYIGPKESPRVCRIFVKNGPQVYPCVPG